MDSAIRLAPIVAEARFPASDIRIENFRDTRLPEGRIDACIGNVPFADVKLEYGGRKLALHDFFFAKSLDGLKARWYYGVGHQSLYAG